MEDILAPLTPSLITVGLETHLLGRRVLCYESIGSTNDLAKQLAQSGEPEGTAVLAEEQTLGRGRLGRTWQAPPRSSVLMSLLLRPSLSPDRLGRVTMAAALGLCDAVERLTGLTARIKWPNDLLLNGKKCAGLLAEASLTESQPLYVVLGIGVNVNFAAAQVPGLAPNATTISDEWGRRLSRVSLIQAMLKEIERHYLRVVQGQDLHDEWAARLAMLHQPVRVLLSGGEESGLAEDVDADGALLLRRKDRSIVRITAGDVILGPR